MQAVANVIVDKISGATATSVALKNYNNWNNGYNVTGILSYKVQGKVGSTDKLQGTNIGEKAENTECELQDNNYSCYGYGVKPGRLRLIILSRMFPIMFLSVFKVELTQY